MSIVEWTGHKMLDLYITLFIREHGTSTGWREVWAFVNGSDCFPKRDNFSKEWQ